LSGTDPEYGVEWKCAHPRRLVLQWHVTERCNFRCAHCYQEGYAGDEPGREQLEAVLGQFVELLRRWKRELLPVPGSGQINVTGGEPLTRPDLLELLERIRDLPEGLDFALLTNGSLIDDHIARRLARLRPLFVQVSLEGGRATNDRVRGSGTFARAVAGLESLVRHGVPCTISFTAQRSQYREFEQVARIGCELGVTRVWSDRLIPWGSGARDRGEVLSASQTRDYFDVMRRARERASASFGRTQVALGRALQFLVGGGEPYRCAAGDRLLALAPNGDVYPCRRMPIRVGNVHEQTLTEIYYGSPLLRRLRDPGSIPAGCEPCRHAARCGGGLRCLSFALTGDPFRADPGCWHAAAEA